jgi:hypothetical protein
MKTSVCTHSRNQGSILFVSLMLAFIIGLSLAGYLVLTAGQEQSVTRSQRWNTALDVAEAGIEEGLAQVNASPIDFSLNGWGGAGAVFGPQTRAISNGKYSVVVVGTAIPAIYSTGYVSAPITGTVLKRTIKVTTQVLPLFNVGLGAVGNINMNGNSMATDSWNSHSAALSDNGVYDPTRTSTNGDVASEQGIVNIGQHKIDGNLYLGPTATYVSGTNQVLGTINTDYNVNFPDVVLPSSAATALNPSVNGGTNYLTSDNTAYVVSNDNHPIVVSPGLTNVTLIVTAQTFDPTSITLQGGMSNAATLTIYDSPPSPGGSVTLTGNNVGGAIGATPVNFIFYGTTNLTSVTLSGNSAFIGAIYAPEATLNLNGGGNSNNLMGSAIVKSASMNGHYDFHYDEALSKFGPPKGFVANSWQEL